MKKMFSAKKVQMLTLMLLCGTTAVMAQNSAGDYSAGTTAGYRDGGNRQVRSHHGQTVLRHCRCCGYRRRYLGVHRHECVRNGCMINTSLARG